ncbi:hypothetical protein R1flu_015865 [Riccia fluitans]|uniref:Uncharacterized protein n=1 Tax=Riccia fluitans TaxID=41844 RepID=A0ABD1YNC0_9MARC
MKPENVGAEPESDTCCRSGVLDARLAVGRRRYHWMVVLISSPQNPGVSAGNSPTERRTMPVRRYPGQGWPEERLAPHGSYLLL